MSELAGYRILGRIDDPADLRALPREELPLLAAEMRRYLVETLSRIGGHFAANLGTVELAIALHRGLATPHDRLIWDIGHQAYPHKMLTGRRAQLETERRLGGLAPFVARSESPYDAFGGGHAATALSAAAGMAAATELQASRRRVVAVIGDGSLTAGVSFEALNHIGEAGLDVLAVLNDNDMSISENVGALRAQAARALARTELAAPHASRAAPEHIPLGDFASLFAALGIAYHGPVDGHDLDALSAAIDALKDLPGPRLLHVVTVKGKGYAPAEADPIGYHGVNRFDPVTGAFAAAASARPSYSRVFGDWLCEAATHDPRIVVITPAMREGSGLVEFAQRFPDRYFDVGIAEQHAVTLAAGLACEGLRPVVAIYSTFLQRGYDQLIHDIALQNLPVLFAIDRGGLVGADGATHHGAFDLAFLRCIPNLLLLTPSNGSECRRMLATGLACNGPVAVRYPRGSVPEVMLDNEMQPLAIGKARIVRDSGGRRRPRVVLLAFGAMLGAAQDAAEILDATVADMRFVKPLDEGLIAELARTHELLVTVEDNVRLGGAGGAVNEALAVMRITTPVLNLGLPDHFVEHGTREELLAQQGLDASGLLRAIQKRLRVRDGDDVESAAQKN